MIHPHRAIPRLRLPLSALLAAALLSTSGCMLWRKKPDPAPDAAPAQTQTDPGNWFCQMAADGSDWDCVQDEHLARDPQPERVPVPPEPVAAPAPGLSPEPGLRSPERLSRPSSLRENVPAPSEPDTAPGDTESAAPAPPDIPAEADPNPSPPPAEPDSAQRSQPYPGSHRSDVAATDLPAYLALSYQPPTPTRLLDLPDHFYTVQVMAVSNRDVLEAYAESRSLTGMSATQIAANGKVMYALLAGIYASRANAETASRSLPAAVADETPWVRSLGSLKRAMLAAQPSAETTTGEIATLQPASRNPRTETPRSVRPPDTAFAAGTQHEVSDRGAGAEQLPTYQRLAFSPDEPVALSALPGDFYAIQVVALSTPDAVEDYAASRNLAGLSAARIEANNKIYFALLLGVYRTRAQAQTVLNDLPQTLAGTRPWIRRVSSLQSAIRRGDSMIASRGR